MLAEYPPVVVVVVVVADDEEGVVGLLGRGLVVWGVADAVLAGRVLFLGVTVALLDLGVVGRSSISISVLPPLEVLIEVAIIIRRFLAPMEMSVQGWLLACCELWMRDAWIGLGEQFRDTREVHKTNLSWSKLLSKSTATNRRRMRNEMEKHLDQLSRLSRGQARLG